MRCRPTTQACIVGRCEKCSRPNPTMRAKSRCVPSITICMWIIICMCTCSCRTSMSLRSIGKTVGRLSTLSQSVESRSSTELHPDTPTNLPIKPDSPKPPSPRLDTSSCPKGGMGGKMRRVMRRLDFDIHSVRADNVLNCILFMLEEFNVLSQLKINEDRFRGFLLELRSHHIVSHP